MKNSVASTSTRSPVRATMSKPQCTDGAKASRTARASAVLSVMARNS